MQKKLVAVLIQISVFSIILLIGWFFYSSTMSSYDVLLHTTTGITASQYPSSNNLDVNYFLMDVNTLNNTIYLTFDFRYFSNGTHAVSFTLPYKVLRLDNLKEEGNWLFNNSESGSIVTVFSNINESLPYGVDSKNFRAKLYLEDSVVDRIFETRSVTLPFGGSITLDIHEVREEIRNVLPLGFIGSGYTGTLTIAVPKSAIITATTVPISRIDSVKDYKVLEFQLSEFKPFQLQYVDPEARRDFEVNLLLSGILIGAAVSGLAGVFIDNAKNLIHPAKNLKSTSSGNSLNKGETKKINKNTIIELIRIVDSNKVDLFKYYDIFRGGWGITLASLTVIVVFIFTFVFVAGVILKLIPIIDQIVLVLSQLTLFFAFFSLTARIGEKHVLEIRFKRALGLKQFTEDEKPFLKALIKLRSRNPEMDLERIYNLHPEMFTQEKLLEKLYADKLFG